MGGTANKVALFNLAAGPPAAIFPAVPSDGFIPFADLGGQVSGTHIRPIKQVLPTVDAWNATVQRQISNTMSLEVAYVGSKGTHGFAGNGPNYDVNPNAVGPGTDVVVVPDPTKPAVQAYKGFTPTASQNSRRPLFPQIPFDLGNYYGNDAASTYNAFEVKVEKRFAQGLQFLSHYTYSHADNYDSNYYAVSHNIAWGPADFNRNQVFVFNTVYELPFGKGKKFMGGSGRALDYAIGGWQISDTTNWSSGLPWTASYGECGDEQDAGICRPDKGSGSFTTKLGSFDPVTHTVPYFTPVAALSLPDPNSLALGTDACSLDRPTSGPFSTPACGALGNIGRNTFHGPAGFYSDLSVSKKFLITEKFSAQFRMDAFNVFNHPVYAFSANNGASTCIDCQGGTNGKITSLEGGTTMRQLQFALRFDF